MEKLLSILIFWQFQRKIIGQSSPNKDPYNLKHIEQDTVVTLEGSGEEKYNLGDMH